MGHELPIRIIKFVFWDLGYMHHPIKRDHHFQMSNQYIYQHLSKFGGVLKW